MKNLTRCDQIAVPRPPNDECYTAHKFDRAMKESRRRDGQLVPELDGNAVTLARPDARALLVEREAAFAVGLDHMDELVERDRQAVAR